MVWAQVHHSPSSLPRLAQDCLCFSVWSCALAWRTQWRICPIPSSMAYLLLSGRCLRRRCPHLSLLPVCSCYSSLSIQRLSASLSFIFSLCLCRFSDSLFLCLTVRSLFLCVHPLSHRPHFPFISPSISFSRRSLVWVDRFQWDG